MLVKLEYGKEICRQYLAARREFQNPLKLSRDRQTGLERKQNAKKMYKIKKI